MDEDSDDDDDDSEILGKMEDLDDKDVKSKPLGPEEAEFSGELADGVNRIKVSPLNCPIPAFPDMSANTTGNPA